MSIQVLAPGEPNAMYHWVTEQEDFLVLAGEALLIVEGQERLLRRWDFVHCPPGTQHVFVGAGEGPCVILAASSRQFQEAGPWGYYTVDDAARRHNACADVETQDSATAYARRPDAGRALPGWRPAGLGQPKGRSIRAGGHTSEAVGLRRPGSVTRPVFASNRGAIV
jgi:uncharacterized cupin superfamily protein